MDCGAIEDIGWLTAQDGSEWTDEKARAYLQNRKDKSLAPKWNKETMKARAKRHIKKKHMGENSYHDFTTIEEGVASLMYISQCIEWKVAE